MLENSENFLHKLYPLFRIIYKPQGPALAAYTKQHGFSWEEQVWKFTWQSRGPSYS